MKNYADIEYRMSAAMADEVLKSLKAKGKGNKQEILCKYVNENLGVKGNCVLVSTTL